MKKAIAILLVFILVLPLTACGVKLNDTEQYVAEAVERLQKRANDPDTMKLRSDILYVTVVEKDGTSYYCTLIDAIIDGSRKTSIFINNIYSGTTDDETKYPTSFSDPYYETKWEQASRLSTAKGVYYTWAYLSASGRDTSQTIYYEGNTYQLISMEKIGKALKIDYVKN